MSALEELKIICQRYLDASDTRAPDSKQGKLMQAIKVLMGNITIRFAASFFQELNKPNPALSGQSILQQIQGQKIPLKSPAREGFKYFLVVFLNIFLAAPIIVARIKTGGWNPLRLTKDKSELFLESLEAIKNKYHFAVPVQTIPSAFPPVSMALSAVSISLPTSATVTFSDLPEDVLGEVVRHLSRDTLSHFVCTGAYFHGLYDLVLRQKQANELIQKIVYGDLEVVKNILAHRPDLVLLAANTDITDYSGRIFKGYTPLQAAYASGGDDELLKMVVDTFKRVPTRLCVNGKAEAKRQLDEKFFEKEPKEIPFDFSTIATAIIQASDDEVQDVLNKSPHLDSALGQALDHFREEFTQISLKKDKLFNPQHLINVFKECDQQFENFKTCKQCTLFCIQVIGFVQRFVAPWIAKALSQGLYYMAEEHQPLQKGFKLLFEGEEPAYYYPLTVSVASGLGFDYWVSCFTGRLVVSPVRVGGASEYCSSLERYITPRHHCFTVVCREITARMPLLAKSPQ